MPAPSIIIVPGWRDSGPGHWQSLWADPERRGVLADFAPVPYQRLPYESILVGGGFWPLAFGLGAGGFIAGTGPGFSGCCQIDA